MKLTAQVRLYPTKEQVAALKHTLEQANAACDFISQRAWETRTFKRYPLQSLTYYEVKAKFGLSAQMVIRCLAKVADAYLLDTDQPRRFRPLGSIAYDDRILSWYTDNDAVSIWTVNGREHIPYGAGERQRERLRYRQGETDLVYWNGMFFLLATCEIPDPDERDVAEALGVDLGVTNIATTSDGEIMTSEPIERHRQRMQKLRADLQARGSLSAKHHLRKLAGRQYRFQKDTNHVIARRLMDAAQRTNRAIALEELTGIRARLAGIPVRVIDPRHTSQQCSCCGYIDPRNRRSQAEFLCLSCGHTDHADVNAAKNIAVRATVISPIVSDAALSAAPETSPRL
jgi:predicted transposase